MCRCFQELSPELTDESLSCLIYIPSNAFCLCIVPLGLNTFQECYTYGEILL